MNPKIRLVIVRTAVGLLVTFLAFQAGNWIGIQPRILYSSSLLIGFLAGVLLVPAPKEA